MKIFVDYKDYETGLEHLKIESAIYVSDYTIQLQFSDGTEKLVNFGPFLSKSLYPSIHKYLDKSLFSTFDLIDGNLNWNGYNLIFPICDLCKGKIS